MLAFVVGLRTTLDAVCLAGFVCSGLARLARFNATVALIPKDEAGKSRYFEGLPIPSTLFIVGLLAWWTKMGWIINEQGVPFGVVHLWESKTGSGEVHLVSLLFVAWAAMMVSKTLHIPKL